MSEVRADDYESGYKADWEAEVKIWRKGRLQRRERGLGADALMAYFNATTDLLLELQIDDGSGHE